MTPPEPAGTVLRDAYDVLADPPYPKQKEFRGMTGPYKVTKSNPPETKEILAEAIVHLGEAMARFNANGLNRRAVIVLIQDATKLSKRDIETVLDALPRLRAWYCR